MKRYVLDACALIALLQDEQGAEVVSDALNSAYKGEAEIMMHKANVSYIKFILSASVPPPCSIGMSILHMTLATIVLNFGFIINYKCHPRHQPILKHEKIP